MGKGPQRAKVQDAIRPSCFHYHLRSCSYINLSQILSLYLQCLDTREPGGWKYLFSCNGRYVATPPLPEPIGLLEESKDTDWRWITESLLMITWAGCTESAFCPGFVTVAFRHKPVTPKITGRFCLCPRSRPGTKMFELSFRSLQTSSWRNGWERSPLDVGCVGRWGGGTWCKYVQLAAHVVLFIQFCLWVLDWEVWISTLSLFFFFFL